MKKFLICLSFLGVMGFSSQVNAGAICDWLKGQLASDIENNADVNWNLIEAIVLLECWKPDAP
ncbi:MAG: hypothetical protein LAT68_08155 [Cyclobacteriaceae bacterium]|nr:hypothetical protein [Cyclobacteriaceae bacterium]MCH8516287.1 hypothetical protein [Cyclobacteriaceae bacterium]